MNFIKKSKSFSLLSLFLLFTLKAKFVFAQATSSALTRFKNLAADSGYSTYNIRPQVVIVRFIIIALSFVGLLFLVSIIYAGFQILTSAGNEEKISEAKDRLKNSVIGLAVIIGAYIVTTFVINLLMQTTNVCYYCWNLP